MSSETDGKWDALGHLESQKEHYVLLHRSCMADVMRYQKRADEAAENIKRVEAAIRKLTDGT